jgi:hypothetical protein
MRMRLEFPDSTAQPFPLITCVASILPLAGGRQKGGIETNSSGEVNPTFCSSNQSVVAGGPNQCHEPV